MSQHYYLNRKHALLRQHKRMLKVGRRVMMKVYPVEDVPIIIQEATQELETLIPEIPYIGGKDNPLTDTLEQMTTLLALYKVLKRRGKSIETIGVIVQKMAQQYIQQYPKFLRHLIGRYYLSRWNRRRVAKNAQRSQSGEYPANFVYEVVSVDDGTWGVNYLECGVQKFFHEQDADEFTPYMCLVDFLIFPAMGINLLREGTLANGCTHCDFRFKQH